MIESVAEKDGVRSEGNYNARLVEVRHTSRLRAYEPSPRG
jgi:hypothetical protein